MPTYFGRRICLALLLIISILVVPLAMADDQAMFITSPGCVKCAAAEKVLEDVLAEYPDVSLIIYEVYSDEGRNVIKEHRLKGGVPAMVVSNTNIVYKDYQGDETLLAEMIREALTSSSSTYDGPAIAGDTTDSEDLETTNLSLMTSFIAGLVAGFNPCLLGILAFLATAVISSTGQRRDLFYMVISFSFGIFAMYYLFGVGMLRTLNAGAMTSKFTLVVTIILLVLGLLHVEDARRLKSGSSSLFRARWSQKYIDKTISKGRLSSYFLLGALFSLVKAPCVGAVYVVILGLIAEQGYSAGAVYLLFYNLGVILPVILLGSVIALGMSPEKVDRFRKNHRAGIRLATGLTLLALAPLIYWQMI